MTLLTGLANLLEQEGHGVYQENVAYTEEQIGITVGTIPTIPSRVVSINVYGGTEADTKLPYDEPSIQVRVRGTEYVADAYQRAQAIYDDWHGLEYLTLSDGTFVLSIIGNQSGPIPMGRDDNGKYEYSINFSLEYVHHTSGRS